MISAGELHERGAELGVMRSLLARSRDGSGGAIVFRGPCGIGKTRLLTEARRLGTPDLHTTVVGASRLDRDLPFGAVRQLFNPLLAELSAQERRDLLSGPSSSQATRALDTTVPAEAAPGGFSVVHGLFRLASELSRDKPMALIIDQLQWADPASLRFLAHLMAGIEQLSCCVIAAVEDEEPPPDLLKRIMADPACTVLRPQPLGEDSIGALIREHFVRAGSRRRIGRPFVQACQKATGGNPLFVRELVEALVAQQLPATPDSVADLGSVDGRMVKQRVTRTITRLPETCGRLALSVAVLGESVPLAEAAQVADLPLDAAQGAAVELERAGGILERKADEEEAVVGFVHPLVHAAVYEAASDGKRREVHRRTAAVLHARGEDAEVTAVHLLRTLPGHDTETVQLLLQASDAALARGAPETAAAYLRRCLEEPLTEERRVHVLHELSRTSLMIDTTTIEDLAEALRLTTQPRRRAEIALGLGSGLLRQHRTDEALEVWQRALADVPEDETELFHQVQACILAVPFYEPGRPDMRRGILRQVAEFRVQEAHPTLSGKALDCVVAGHDAVLGDPRAVPRALRALHGSASAELADLPGGDVALSLGWMVLISADRDEALESLRQALLQAHRMGSLNVVATALTYRALAWLARGDLAEAEADAQQAVSAAETCTVALPRFALGLLRADILIEQGRLEEAEEALGWVQAPQLEPPTGLMYHLCSRSRLLRRQGRPEQALEAALTAGRSYEAAGGENPALVPWQSEAALSLHLLDRDDEALGFAYDELRLARNWSAPRAWGRALRVLGLLQAPAHGGLDHLREAVSRLEPSPARLEYARALAQYATALRAVGRPREAAQSAEEALDLAEHLGAQTLIEQIRGEQPLEGTAVPRPKRPRPDLMPPSERRICELAAAGRTNREIAEELFVTLRAVETHISQACRELGVSTRRELAERLEPTAQSGRSSG